MNLAVSHPHSRAPIPHVSVSLKHVYCVVITTIISRVWCVGGKLNLGRIGATATQGPRNQSDKSRGASLAIDGRIVTGYVAGYTSKLLAKNKCAASKASSSVRSWLRIDLQIVYLINKVVVTFYGTTGSRTIIRVGSNTSNDGNDNLLCGTVENYAGWIPRPTKRTVMCKERLWGRYVNLQRPTTGIQGSTGNLEICEVEIYNSECHTRRQS